MSREVLLNGRFIPYEEAVVPIGDRGFQFAEGVYEVIRVYRARPFEMDRHLRRLRMSLEAIGLSLGSSLDELQSQSLELLRRSGLQEAAIYIQITSGVAPRSHLAPPALEPTVLAMVGPASPPAERLRREGITAITVPDDRWARCYVKTTMLLPNTAAKRRAVAAGCDEAIFVRDGFVMEATAANLFALFDGVLTTAPASNYILHGVTRAVVLDLAKQLSIPSLESPIPLERLFHAEELFLTGTVSELVPIRAVDGQTIGNGGPGPLFTRLHEAYQRRALGE